MDDIDLLIANFVNFNISVTKSIEHEKNVSDDDLCKYKHRNNNHTNEKEEHKNEKHTNEKEKHKNEKHTTKIEKHKNEKKIKNDIDDYSKKIISHFIKLKISEKIKSTFCLKDESKILDDLISDFNKFSLSTNININIDIKNLSCLIRLIIEILAGKQKCYISYTDFPIVVY